LEKQGVLDIIRGLDGAESLRLASHLEINNMSNLTVKGTDALELKSEQSIIMLSYLLGRLAFVRDNKVEYIIPNKTEVAPKIIKTTKSKSTLHYARKAEKDKKVTEVNIIPTIYMSQLYRMDEKED
jgi:hypothetical protein